MAPPDFRHIGASRSSGPGHRINASATLAGQLPGRKGLEQTLDKLNAMKLFALVKSLKERLERQDHQSLSKAEFVGLLVDDGKRPVKTALTCVRRVRGQAPSAIE